MKLRSWLLHVVETACIVENVRVSAAAVGLVNDASIAHHVLSVKVAHGGGRCGKSRSRMIPMSNRIRELHLATSAIFDEK